VKETLLLRLVNLVNNYSSKLKYKLGVSEIVALVIAVGLIMLLSSYAKDVVKVENDQFIVFIVILSFFSALYGPIVGIFVGFLGVVCGLAIHGIPVPFGDAIAMGVFGGLIGQFAGDYMIRDGGFGRRQIILFLSMQGIACILSLVLIKPFFDYLFYNKDLFRAMYSGIRGSVIVAIPINFALAILFYVINAFYINAKS